MKKTCSICRKKRLGIQCSILECGAFVCKQCAAVPGNVFTTDWFPFPTCMNCKDEVLSMKWLIEEKPSLWREWIWVSLDQKAIEAGLKSAMMARAH